MPAKSSVCVQATRNARGSSLDDWFTAPSNKTAFAELSRERQPLLLNQQQRECKGLRRVRLAYRVTGLSE